MPDEQSTEVRADAPASGRVDDASGTQHDVADAVTALQLTADGPILFYDGHCGLCDHSVTFVLRRDRQSVFRFAQLQGQTAAQCLPSADVELLKSVVLCDALGTYRKSSAVVRILWWLGGRWKICSWLIWLVPRPIRNLGYAFISRTRYYFFGRYETCRLPTESERDRMLP